MFKQLSTLAFCSATFAASAFAEAQDINLGLYPCSGYVLQRGVLQVDGYGHYSNVDMGEALGADMSGAKGNGTYSELGGRVWFGASEYTTLSFFGGYSDFAYTDKEANIGYQEFRVKRALLVDHPAWGFWAIEGGWFRHSLNKLTQDGYGSVGIPRINSDYGYNSKLSMTKAISDTWDFNSHLGYNKALVDGVNGQYNLELGAGASRFWSNRYRFDLYATTRKIFESGVAGASNMNNSLHMGITRYLTDHWSVDLSAQYNDNLFRGVWPFFDGQMDRLSMSDYGYIALGFSYRTRY